MSQHRAVYFASVLFLLAVAPAAWAVNHTVELSGHEFTPSVLNIQVGDSVTWTNVEGFHDTVADDGSFSSGPPASNPWTFSRTFNSAGSFRYYCTIHGAPGGVGMSGIVNVSGGSGGEQRGTLGFSLAAYALSEGGGSTTITVQRTNGDDGPVSVHYATSNGTATAGSDYTAASGTLSWADGDDSPKTFTVAVTNDSSDEPNETVNLTLSSPTGGAALHPQRRTATLTIQDNDDGSPGGTPAAPSGLQAAAQSTSEILVSWTDNSTNETGFRLERKTLGGTFQEIASLPANTTSHTVSGLTAATQYVFRVRAVNGANFSAYSNEAGAATDTTPGPCLEGPNTLCINNSRFKVEVLWRTGTSQGAGSAVPLDFSPDSGLFHFFGINNIEMLVKVLNACTLNSRYWVFFAATTNVEFTLTVTDTQTGKVKVYFNPLNQAAAPVQDTSAFATCP